MLQFNKKNYLEVKFWKKIDWGYLMLVMLFLASMVVIIGLIYLIIKNTF